MNDRRIQYEVTGKKLDGDDFGFDSDADSDSDFSDSYKSASSSSEGEGNNSLLIASPSSTNALSSKKEGRSFSNYKKKKVTAYMDEYGQMLTSLMQDSITSQSELITTQPKAGVPTSYSINN